MPTYEYVCQKCGLEFETFQSMSDAPLKHCQKRGCKGVVKRKIGGGAGLLFKGSGFYITDYRSAGYKSKAKAEGSSPATSKPAATKSGGT